MKLCKDCKHCTPLTMKFLWITHRVPGSQGLEKCGATIDLVSGKAEKFCEFERKPTGGCGPDAKNFVLAYS